MNKFLSSSQDSSTVPAPGCEGSNADGLPQMRVMIDMGNAPPKTGIGIYGATLLRMLQRYNSRELIAVDSTASWPGYHFRPARRLVYLWNLRRLYRQDYCGADIVHFVNYYVPRRHNHVRYVTTIHDLDPVKAPEAHTRRYTLYFEHLLKGAIANADIIETHSEFVRQELLDTFSISPDRVRVAGDGPSPEFVERAQAQPKTSPSVPTLLYVGLISKKKNVEWLVRTITDGVRKRALPNLHLIVAGGLGHTGPDAVKAIQDSNGIATWVERPPLQRLVELYCSCSAVVLPSLREGLGRTLIEAMWCDRPMVASRIPACIEVAREAACYFDLGSADSLYHAVLESLEDRHAERRREISRIQCERYSWERLTRLFVNIYKEAYLMR
jgi:glycosyltransferase involved in cell wall biosynthesis